MPGRPRDAAKTERGTMPNEQINHGKPFLFREIDATEGSPSGYVTDVYPGGPPPEGWSVLIEPSLKVHWTRQHDEVLGAGNVQISLDVDRLDLLRSAREVEQDDAITKRGIYTGSLDRAELNHLIRTLKRARDAAYGKDE
jgi:hypothetical protein